MRILRPRKEKRLVQIHIRREWREQELKPNPVSLPVLPESMMRRDEKLRLREKRKLAPSHTAVRSEVWAFVLSADSGFFLRQRVSGLESLSLFFSGLNSSSSFLLGCRSQLSLFQSPLLGGLQHITLSDSVELRAEQAPSQGVAQSGRCSAAICPHHRLLLHVNC